MGSSKTRPASQLVRSVCMSVRPDIPELVNLQNVKGQAKPYQMRQFLKLVEKHDLKLEDE